MRAGYCSESCALYNPWPMGSLHVMHMDDFLDVWAQNPCSSHGGTTHGSQTELGDGNTVQMEAITEIKSGPLLENRCVGQREETPELDGVKQSWRGGNSMHGDFRVLVYLVFLFLLSEKMTTNWPISSSTPRSTKTWLCSYDPCRGEISLLSYKVPFPSLMIITIWNQSLL